MGGSTAACTPASSTTVSATTIFIYAVQQWELGASKNQYCSLPQLSALTSPLLSQEGSEHHAWTGRGRVGYKSSVPRKREYSAKSWETEAPSPSWAERTASLHSQFFLAAFLARRVNFCLVTEIKAHFPSAERLQREPLLLLSMNGPQGDTGDTTIIKETANKK